MAFKWPFKRVFVYCVFYNYTDKDGSGVGRARAKTEKKPVEFYRLQQLEECVKAQDPTIIGLCITGIMKLKTEWVWQWRF